jgi:hypothetical protein
VVAGMIATTRAALLRGETEDALGDEIDATTVVAGFGDFAVSIIETSRNEFDESSNTWRTVRYYAGRVSTRVPVKAGDRIRDNRDATIYTVSEAERTARGLSGRSSVTLTMKRTAP